MLVMGARLALENAPCGTARRASSWDIALLMVCCGAALAG